MDTQHVLPFGTEEEVRQQVAERVRILNEGGGFIFNTIHNVVANVPPENLIAMYETVLGEKLRKIPKKSVPYRDRFFVYRKNLGTYKTEILEGQQR